MTNDSGNSAWNCDLFFCFCGVCFWNTDKQGGMRMTVYADEAFLLNGAVDYLLLICAAKLGGGRIARLRLLAAALFGGLVRGQRRCSPRWAFCRDFR